MTSSVQVAPKAMLAGHVDVKAKSPAIVIEAIASVPGPLFMSVTVCAVLVAWPIQAYEWSGTVTWPKALIVHPLFVVALLAMFAQSFNPFLYFQF